jgi:hypothetical protein
MQSLLSCVCSIRFNLAPLPPAAPTYTGGTSVYHETVKPATGSSAAASSLDAELERKKRELMELEKRRIKEEERMREAAEKTKTISKKKKMISGKFHLESHFLFHVFEFLSLL